MLRGERDHGRGAAKCRRNGRTVEIIGARDTRRRALLDMAMAVDAAGQDQLAARIDSRRSGREVLPDHHDAAVLYPDAATRQIGCVRHGPTADHQIVVAHLLPLLKASTTPLLSAPGQGLLWRIERRAERDRHD